MPQISQDAYYKKLEKMIKEQGDEEYKLSQMTDEEREEYEKSKTDEEIHNEMQQRIKREQFLTYTLK